MTRKTALTGVLLAAALTGGARAAVSTDTVAAVTLSTSVGLGTSVALDNLNNVHAAYYDPTAQKVKYALLANGTNAWAVSDVDAAADVHSTGTALVLDSARNPHVFFYDITNQALKHTRRVGGVWTTPDTVEAFASTQVYVAAAMGTDGRARAVYTFNPSSATHYAAQTGVGTSWSTATALGALGGTSSIALDASNNPFLLIVNDDLFFGLRFLSLVTGNGSNFISQPLDVLDFSTSTVMPRVSVAVDSLGNAHISYYSNFLSEFIYAVRAPDTSVTFQEFSGGTFFGRDSSLALTSQRRPVIAVSSDTVGLELLSFNGVSWSTTTFDASAQAGAGNSLLLNSFGHAFVTYMDGAGAAKFATDANRGLSISGTVAGSGGAGIPGVTLTLTGAIASTGTVTPGAGTYSFNSLLEGSYSVTPTLTDYGFLPAAKVYVLQASQSGQDFLGGLVSFSQVDNLIDPTQGQVVNMTYSILGGRILIEIYNLGGRLVRTIVDEDKTLGTYTATWDGRNDRGDIVASGIYLVRVRAGGIKKVEKVAVVK